MHGSGYNFLSRLTHRIALQYPAVAQASFDLENFRYPFKNQTTTKPVFISGLARSGTSILLQYLYKTGAFSSLTYRDMPFVLMPGTWRKLPRQHKDDKLTERAHLDGIQVGQHSPEAFEEVFWRIFCGTEYILKDRLMPHLPGGDVPRKFNCHIGHVVALNNDKRYLSKNNSNILRLGYLQQAFPDAAIIVPFRDPLQQAISLREQHQRFCDLQRHDRFILDYMNWLGHFEFGLGQKSFFLNDDATFSEMASFDKDDINFWLLTWKNYYQYLNHQPADNILLFDYEVFCADPCGAMSRLLMQLAVEGEIIQPVSFTPQIKKVEGINQLILDACEDIYAELKQKAVRQKF